MGKTLITESVLGSVGWKLGYGHAYQNFEEFVPAEFLVWVVVKAARYSFKIYCDE